MVSYKDRRTVVRLSIPAKLSFRDLALTAVAAALESESAGTQEEAHAEVTSAVGEAFNNIVLHAYRDVRGGQIDLHVDARGNEVEIHLYDRGHSFDFATVPEPDLDALPECGMGLFIMRSFMDDVTYTRGGAGAPNVLVLRKKWPAGSDSESDSERSPATDVLVQKKETSQSGWRMRSVAVPIHAQSTAGSLRRK